MTLDKKVIQLSVLIILYSFFACTSIKTDHEKSLEQNSLIKLNRSQYPVFCDDMAYDNLKTGILNSLLYLNKVDENKEFVFGNDTFSAKHMIKSLNYFLEYIKSRPDVKELNNFIKKNYYVYKSIGRPESEKVLFTGYYEPCLKGSKIKTSEYSVPIFSKPYDLISVNLSDFNSAYKGQIIYGRSINNKLIPYHTREEIEETNILNNKALPIAWINSEIDLFFLQVQGSGKIYLDDGETINVHYHATNGHAYKSIGKLLIQEDKISKENISMQSIKKYLEDNPKEIRKVLNYNPSYVFFTIEQDGPLGALNVKLTPARSIATDKNIFPKAGLCFIKTKQPILDANNKIYKWKDLTRFVLNQDTGGAIKTPGRADLFWGNGLYAKIAAGNMQHEGDLYFLILKN